MQTAETACTAVMLEGPPCCGNSIQIIEPSYGLLSECLMVSIEIPIIIQNFIALDDGFWECVVKILVSVDSRWEISSDGATKSFIKLLCFY